MGPCRRYPGTTRDGTAGSGCGAASQEFFSSLSVDTPERNCRMLTRRQIRLAKFRQAKALLEARAKAEVTEEASRREAEGKRLGVAQADCAMLGSLGR